jgi:hypothetical protein
METPPSDLWNVPPSAIGIRDLPTTFLLQLLRTWVFEHLALLAQMVTFRLCVDLKTAKAYIEPVSPAGPPSLLPLVPAAGVELAPPVC